MTIPAPVSIHNGKLMVHGRPVLTKVPSNIVVTQDAQSGCPGVFLGANAAEANSLHVFSLGVLKGFRFICCFRFRLWWMTHAMGDCGRDIPSETQFLLLESRHVTNGGTYDSDGNCLDPDGHNNVEYIVFLPLLDGPFRASLQGSDNDEVHLCLESGDPVVQARGGLHSIFVHVGSDPFQVVGDAVRAVEEHLQSFRHREKKKLPPILDWFGWCTWDAFYTDVTAEGVMEGLQSLCTGGAPPRFLIIDDGWQSITSAEEEVDGKLTSGTQFARRLSGIKENHKFKNGLVNMAHDEIESAALGRTAISGLKRFIQEAKQRYNLKFVYMWHAITGYWGGVKPGLAGMEHYESRMAYPVHSPGVLVNQPDIALDSATVNGLGLPHPQKVFNFYDELHSYLANAGIDGVKVDGQSILESVAAGHGGRVKLTKEYQLALEASIARNFPDNGIIACMSHHNDGIYSTKHTAVVRASDDFWPRDPASHTIHIASVAYNSLFLGEFMQPDWDMFHSLHPAAEYHAAARAVGGCGIYVSDTPGQHDFNLLKKLVFHDGSVLRARLPGRPTKDCLFADPARDGRSLLKIWNMNEHTGVVGAFNCQGAGWCKVDKANKIHDETPKEVTGTVQAEDVPYLQSVAPKDWGGDVVTYCHRTGGIVFLGGSATLHVTLKVLEYEIFTFSPVKVLSPGVSFAPIGLLNMMNSGGAIKSLDYQVENGVATVKMLLRGHGRFGAFASKKPRSCSINSCPVSFDYRIDIGLLSFDVGWPMEDLPVVHVEL